MFIILSAAVLYIKFTTPVYEATAKIIYKEPNEAMLFSLNNGRPFYDKSAIMNTREQLTSRTLSEAVARILPEHVIQLFNSSDDLKSNISDVKYIASLNILFSNKLSALFIESMSSGLKIDCLFDCNTLLIAIPVKNTTGTL